LAPLDEVRRAVVLFAPAFLERFAADSAPRATNLKKRLVLPDST
jgi:hypothetical protein